MNVYDEWAENEFFREIYPLAEAQTGEPEAMPSDECHPEIPPTHVPILDWRPCEFYYKGWCRAVPGKQFHNIEYLEVCPKDVPEDCSSRAPRNANNK